MNASVETEVTALPSLQQKPQMSLAPRDLAEAIQFAEIMAKSSIVPKDFANNAGNILVAVQWGMELGLQPMQAMQNIAVINGRPSLWGDAVIALVKSSPLCEYVIEEEQDGISICRVKRRGEHEQVRTFTDADAKAAGLIGKQGPWTQYPRRMRQMRARSWALRDVFPDVLRGMPIAEEVMDMPEKDVTPPSGTPNRMEEKFYPAADFDKNLPSWTSAIQSGKKSAEQIIAMVFSKGKLTAEQETAIRSVKASPAPGKNQPAAQAVVDTIRLKAEEATLSESDICKHLNVESLDGITVAQAEAAIAFIANPMGA